MSATTYLVQKTYVIFLSHLQIYVIIYNIV